MLGEMYNERKLERNSRLSTGENELQQRPNNYDNKSVENRNTSQITIELDEKTKTNDLVSNEKKSTTNSRKKLDCLQVGIVKFLKLKLFF